jgi:hypothetical protein
MEQDKIALRASNAGMRLIAQTTIYNSGDAERLTQFVTDSYHDNALEENSAAKRLEEFQTLFSQIGRMKVKQVVGTNKHHAVVILEAEKDDGFYYTEIEVEEDYPHKILRYQFVKMREVEE